MSRSLLLPAGPSVPKPDAHSGGAFIHHRSHTAGEHHVAGRIVHAAHLVIRQNLHVRVVHPDAVRRQHVRPQQSDAFEILHRDVGAILCQAVDQFLSHFRHVNQDGRVIFAGQRRGIPQRLFEQV